MVRESRVEATQLSRHRRFELGTCWSGVNHLTCRPGMIISNWGSRETASAMLHGMINRCNLYRGTIQCQPRHSLSIPRPLSIHQRRRGRSHACGQLIRDWSFTGGWPEVRGGHPVKAAGWPCCDCGSWSVRAADWRRVCRVITDDRVTPSLGYRGQMAPPLVPPGVTTHPITTLRVVSMLGQRLRRWPSIGTTRSHHLTCDPWLIWGPLDSTSMNRNDLLPPLVVRVIDRQVPPASIYTDNAGVRKSNAIMRK